MNTQMKELCSARHVAWGTPFYALSRRATSAALPRAQQLGCSPDLVVCTLGILWRLHEVDIMDY